MRKAISNLERYIGTVRVAKHRIFVWFSNSTLCSNKIIVIARNDDYLFGVLHSRVHEIWSLANASRHGDGGEGGRPTYTPSTCFETFPFPWAPSKEPKDDPRVKSIAQAAKELVEQRNRWLNAEQVTVTSEVTVTSSAEKKKRTLTNLYNQRSTWLDLAHKKLDEAVFAAYGWKPDLSDEEILEKLLALNLSKK